MVETAWVPGAFQRWVRGVNAGNRLTVHQNGGFEQRPAAGQVGPEVDVVFPVVALQVAFERQILKPIFHLIGFRLWV
jgi:hypothetical protein